MVTQPQRALTYEDLQAFPEDNLRRELIDGELIVTAAPSVRHQLAVMVLAAQLFAYARQHGALVLPAPTDVFFTEANVVEPDVLFVRADHLERVEERFIRGAPDVVIEVSSPSTRRLELRRKLELYERFGVPEYWYVDLEAERVELYRLADNGYGMPQLLARDASITSERLPGFSLPVGEAIPQL